MYQKGLSFNDHIVDYSRTILPTMDCSGDCRDCVDCNCDCSDCGPGPCCDCNCDCH